MRAKFLVIFIEKPAPASPRAIICAFQDTIERLVDLPQSGAPRPALGRNTRIAIVQPYLLIYDYTRGDETLTLLRILHGRRNITRALMRR
jgi:toxin ParE1/3/4